MRLGRAGFLAVLSAMAFFCPLRRHASEVHAEDRATLADSRKQSVPAPIIQVYSRETLVDVTVTDKDGKPVHGLTQDDFTVKEDGKPQPLKSFEEYGAAKPSQAIPAPLPPNVYTNAQPPAPTSGAVDILMFDNLTTGLAHQLLAAPAQVMYEKTKAIRYLDSIPAGTQVAIMELSDGLRVVQSFTSDRALLVAAINSMVYQPVQGAYHIPDDPTPLCYPANEQSELVVNGLTRAAAFLAGVKGRKNLIWFTPGTPWLTSYGRFSGNRCGLRDFTPQLTGVYGLLTAAQVALYPVDPRGVEECARPMAETDDTNRAPVSASTLTGTSCFNILPDEHMSLDDMARATGGQAYYNRNDVDGAVRDAIETGTDYYALSYAPPDPKYDGKYHTIRVKVDRPSVQLVYRDSYTSLDPAAMAKLATDEAKSNVAKGDAAKARPPLGAFEMALGHGASPSTQLLFNVRVTPAAAPTAPPPLGSLNPRLKDKRLVRYNFAFALRPDQITLQAAQDGTRKGTLDLAIAVYDGDGKMLNFFSRAGAVSVKPEMLARLLERPFVIPLQLDLPPGALFVRVGVRDVPSQNIGTFEIPLTVAKGLARSMTTEAAPAQPK